MIYSVVSRRRQAGKSYAADVLADAMAGERFSFTSYLKQATTALACWDLGKHEVHPEFGCSTIDIVNKVSEALQSLHPELSVHRVKLEIELAVIQGANVFIDDTRRLREFTWLDSLAEHHGTEHRIIEIFPTFDCPADTWSNGEEACGLEAWRHRGREIVMNDRDAGFGKELRMLVSKGFFA